MSFFDIAEKINNLTFTEKGDVAYNSSLSYCVDYFALVGGKRDKIDQAFSLFNKAYFEDNVMALKLLLYTRDRVNGIGERNLFRVFYHALANYKSEEALLLLPYVPKYGRYDDLGKEKSSFRSLSSTGDGVLLRLTGDDAMLYQEGKIKQTNPISVVIQDITDEQMQNYFDNMFDTSIELPSKVSGAYYQNSNAHVIDTYNLFSNNCTTKAVQAINALGSTFFQEGIVPSPNGRGYELNINKQFTTPVGLCMFLKLK